LRRLNIRNSICGKLAKTYPQCVIALDVMSHRIGADDITKGPVVELEIGARVWERPETDPSVSIKERRVLDVV
jgi:hypothetical protein